MKQKVFFLILNISLFTLPIINLGCQQIIRPPIDNILVPQIINVEEKSNIPGIYDQFELNFQLNSIIDYNPYSDSDIDVYCEFWSPSGAYFKVYGFFFEDFISLNYNCNSTFPCEKLVSTGNQSWKVRFTPNEEGIWSYKLSVSNRYGKISYPSIVSTKTFSCASSSNKGFILQANKKFLKRSTGEFVFPVGPNVAFNNAWSTYTFGTNEYKYYIDSLAENNCNYIRVFLDYYLGIALVGYDYPSQQNYFDFYNQADAWQLDWIFNYAKSKNIDIMLCLFSHSSWGDDSYCNNAWSQKNPFNRNQGGPIETPFDFFTNIQAKNKTKELLKYVIARWGCYTNLLAFELWNEVNQIAVFNPSLDPPPLYQNSIKEWHGEMYSYMKEIDPFKHLITTSFAGGGIDQLSQATFSYFDFIQSHDYQDPSNNPNANFQDHFYILGDYSANNIQKPYMCTEWGFPAPDLWRNNDPKGIELHNSLWSSVFSGSFGAASCWWWDSYVSEKNLFHIFKPIGTFTKGMPMLSDKFSAKKSIQNGMSIYYMINESTDTILGWVQDVNFQYKTLKNTVSGLNYIQTLNPIYKPSISYPVYRIVFRVEKYNGFYNVEWYDTQTGQIFSSIKAQSSGKTLIVIIPPVLRSSTFGDAVFRITLDCNEHSWFEGPLSAESLKNVSSDIICNKHNGQVYYKTFDNKIHSLWWDDQSSKWLFSSLNNTANNVAGDLSISTDGTKIYYRSMDNNINLIYWDNATNQWRWSNLNNASNGNVKGPIVVSPNEQVFYRNQNDGLNNIWKDPSTNIWWWSNLDNSAIGNVGDAIAVSTDVEVFYKTKDNKLNSLIWDPTTTKWFRTDLDMSANSNVCGNITISPHKQVFYKTCDNKLWSIWWSRDQNKWLGSTLNNSASNVAGELFSDNNSRIFYRTINNNINSIYYENDSWHHSNIDYITNSSVASGGLSIDNFGNIFFRSIDNSIHRIYYKSQCFNTPSESFQKMKYIDENNFIENSILTAYNHPIINEINLFPNPVNKVLNIQSEQDIISYTIFNANGQCIKQQKNRNTKNLEIDVSNYQAGAYLIKIFYYNGSFIVKKFLVDHYEH